MVDALTTGTETRNSKEANNTIKRKDLEMMSISFLYPTFSDTAFSDTVPPDTDIPSLGLKGTIKNSPQRPKLLKVREYKIFMIWIYNYD